MGAHATSENGTICCAVSTVPPPSVIFMETKENEPKTDDLMTKLGVPQQDKIMTSVISFWMSDSILSHPHGAVDKQHKEGTAVRGTTYSGVVNLVAKACCMPVCAIRAGQCTEMRRYPRVLSLARRAQSGGNQRKCAGHRDDG